MSVVRRLASTVAIATVAFVALTAAASTLHRCDLSTASTRRLPGARGFGRVRPPLPFPPPADAASASASRRPEGSNTPQAPAPSSRWRSAAISAVVARTATLWAESLRRGAGTAAPDRGAVMMAATGGGADGSTGGMATVVTAAGVAMPALLYGTAWKKERTADLVVRAVRQGFRGIDTACQPKHYREDLVGAALLQLQQEGIPRSALFIQTKFTSVNGQDPATIPYDPRAPLPDQVRQSLAVSFRNLHTPYIDSLVLHSPMPTHEQTMAVWRTLEEYHAQGVLRQLGVSNIAYPELVLLLRDARVPPAVVQNRFHAATGYDREMRALLRTRGIVYQSFWTLTANPQLLQDPRFQQLAAAHRFTPPQLLFKFLTQSGAAPLTGTTSEQHMREDLAVLSAPPLPPHELQLIDALLR